jgi:hypothetical protein
LPRYHPEFNPTEWKCASANIWVASRHVSCKSRC